MKRSEIHFKKVAYVEKIKDSNHARNKNQKIFILLAFIYKTWPPFEKIHEKDDSTTN